MVLLYQGASAPFLLTQKPSLEATMPTRKDIHERVLNAANHEELMAAYADWAANYDDDLLGEMGYVAPLETSKLLQSYLEDKDACILDAGCGTGIVGQCLQNDGFANLHALDYSKDMLEQASKKGVYTALTQADMTKRLDMDDNTFDAIICVGTFTCGHVGPEAFAELVRITKPGGLICFTVRQESYASQQYRDIMTGMEQRGDWELQELRSMEYIQQEGSTCKVALYKVPA